MCGWRVSGAGYEKKGSRVRDKQSAAALCLALMPAINISQ
jgi:hypothetical protein